MMSILSLCNSRLWIFLAISCLFFVDKVHANPQLVADINTLDDTQIINPNNFIEHNGLLIFSAITDPTGRELWATDGDTTWLVRDFRPGSQSGISIEVTYHKHGDGLLLLARNEDYELEIWKTNGYPESTMLAYESAPGSDITITQIIKSNGPGDDIYVLGRNIQNNTELWKIPATLDSIEFLSSVSDTNNSAALSSFDQEGNRFFLIDDEALRIPGRTESRKRLLASSAESTDQIRKGSKFAVLNNHLFYVQFTAEHGKELWKTDGTDEGTLLVKDIYAGVRGSGPENLIVYKNKLYFSATDSDHGYEIWVSDGTEAGTELLKDTDPTTQNALWHFFVFQEHLFFFTLGGDELWKTDGSTLGTEFVTDTSHLGVRYWDVLLGTLGDSVVFAGDTLWKTDGSELGTYVIAENPDSRVAISNGKLYFTTDYDQEIWVSDGTQTGTSLIADYRDYNPDPNPNQSFGAIQAKIAAFFKGRVYVNIIKEEQDPSSFDNLLYQVELWKSNYDLTAIDPVKILRTNGSSNPGVPVEYKGNVYFVADDSITGKEIWVGDKSSTWQLADINPGLQDSDPVRLQVFGDYLYFVAKDGLTGNELWRTDGTAAGTILLKDIYVGDRGSIVPDNNYYSQYITPDFLYYKDEVYFVANSSEAGEELWKTDGTQAGTTLVKDIYPGNNKYSSPISSSPDNFIIFKGEIYFSATSEAFGRELWKTDGTEAGTQQVSNIIYGEYNSSPRELVALGSYLYFKISRFFPTQYIWEEELWMTDGTDSGTKKVDGYPDGQNLHFLGAGESKIFYVRRSPSGQDGSDYIYSFYVIEANSSTLKPIEFRAPVSYWSSVFQNYSFVHNDELYIAADNGLTGKELWKLSATLGRFELVNEFTDGPEGSWFGQYQKHNEGYYLLVNQQLWLLNNTGEVTFQEDLRYLPIKDTKTLVYPFYDSSTGVELWTKTIGIDDQQLIRDVYTGTPSSKPDLLSVIDHSLYFSAIDDIHGRELWRYDLPVQLRGSGVMGDFVWEDSNGNGVYDSNESGLSGVSVDLLRCNGNIVDSVTTDADGQFQFTGINVGDYQMRYHLPTGYHFSPTNKGGNYRFDSNANALTGLTPCLNMADGQKRLAVDAGMIPANTAGTGSMGDFVWHDINANGIQDNKEPGLTNVSIELQTCSGVVVDTETSNADGGFSFTQIPPGDYQMRFQLPSGYSFSPEKQGSNYRYDSNVDPATGLSPCLPIDGHQRNAVDAGMISHNTLGTGSMGDFVWDDLNGDGIQDANEPGMINVIVDLQSCSGEVIESAMTDTSGNFLFTGIATGDYQMYFHLPTGYDYSPTGQGSDYRVDSNVNRDTGLSPCLPINDHRRIAVDAGMMR